MPIQRRIIMPGQVAPPQDASNPMRNTFIGTPDDQTEQKYSKIQELLGGIARGGPPSTREIQEMNRDAVSAKAGRQPASEQDSVRDINDVDTWLKLNKVNPRMSHWISEAHKDDDEDNLNGNIKEFLESEDNDPTDKEHLQNYIDWQGIGEDNG